jgi:N,N'-diacetyllegionaminate synthase
MTTGGAESMTNSGVFDIGGIAVGAGRRCFVIAEAGVNHNGDRGLARELVFAAKSAGADAVKFQTFRAASVITNEAEKAAYQLRNTDPSESQTAMLSRLEMPEDWHLELMELCRQQHIVFLSTPYDFRDVDLLQKLGVPALKLASIHSAEPAFVEYAAATGKPVILATGMATLAEVRLAVEAARRARNTKMVLLQCTTDYPSRLEDANLRVLHTLREAFDLPVGYSDHTQSSVASIAAIALGACVIEKHLTLDRTMPGPDHSASFDPEQFAGFVLSIRQAEAALGSGVKEPCVAERANMGAMRRSIAARRNIDAGEILTVDMIAFLRPASGLAPALLPEFIGRRFARPVAGGRLISADDFATQ